MPFKRYLVRGAFLLPFVADTACLWVHMLYCNSDLFLLQSLLIMNLLYLKSIICSELEKLNMCLPVLCRSPLPQRLSFSYW